MNNIQIYLVVIAGTSMLINMFSQNPDDKIGWLVGTMILAPVYGRVFGWW